MTPKTTAPRMRYASLGLPAAVLGALAATLVPAPAGADAITTIHPIDRGAGTPSARILPTQSVPPQYVVAEGDTIWGIATRFGLRPADVLAWNALPADAVIRPGQALSLTGPAAPPVAPTPPPSASAHTVVTGDTLFGIAQQHGIALDALLAANGFDRASIIYPGQSVVIAAGVQTAPPVPAAPPAPTSHGTYTVVAGDTLFAIAQRHGTSLDVLLATNGLDRSSIIYPGQTLVTTAATAAPAVAPAPAPPAQQIVDLSPEQAANAALIIRIGRELGVSDRGIAIALATGMVESGLRNLDGGDRDSLGIFQQRPSTGWGAPSQIQDADRSTRVFYGGPHDPNGQVTRGLLDIPGWETMSFTSAAQAVQISAYPDRYGQWETASYRWLELYQ